MVALPAFVVAVLCGWFTYLVSRHYFRTYKLNNLFWTISLAMSALASLSYAIALWLKPHIAVFFLMYYLFGAMWMPSIMGLGSLALVFKRRVIQWLAAIIVILGLVGTVFLYMAPISNAALQKLNGGAGVGILSVGTWLPFLIVLNTFGAAAVFLVAVMSAWKTFKRQSSPRFLYGNIWLAVGILVISAAGTAARMGWPELFWFVMLIGWVITFFGYRLLTPDQVVVNQDKLLNGQRSTLV